MQSLTIRLNTSRCRSYNGNSRNCRISPWSSYGRWIALVVIVAFFFLVFFLCACFSARRRRRRGFSPYRGTGWLGGKTPPGHAPAMYTGGQAPAAPPYGEQYGQSYGPGQQYPPQAPPPQYNNYDASNQGYYGGGQQNGIELQSPQNVYQQPQSYNRGEGQGYAPPTSPPPAHKDGIIR
ncbi:MAG: hypothetical protein M1837_001340 [Sclerophora amabilis]|nr:MAG: hypothetical protein M1837_001340 [Sclerophora amabilis]